MLLAKAKTSSLYPLLYWMAHSASRNPPSSRTVSLRTAMGSAWRTCLPELRNFTNETMPPSYLNSCALPVASGLSSASEMRSPLFRKASSRSLFESMSKLNSVVSNISASGLKVTFVPLPSAGPTISSGATGLPLRKLCLNRVPSRTTSTSSHSESAFTTLTPTPWRPPETLYASLSNLPPACRVVRTTSSAERPILACISVGIPRPLSSTETTSSSRSLTSMLSQ